MEDHELAPAAGRRELVTIVLTVPHTLTPGDRYDQPHHGVGDRWLVVAVDGERLTVARWSWWRDRAWPWLTRR